ncbi:unnamed protein product [Amoebophrya sp. A120]|nr:unnamed protein product [Amoebophrya sp. A120]|eukprot:GSA120T00015979001.1
MAPTSKSSKSGQSALPFNLLQRKDSISDLPQDQLNDQNAIAFLKDRLDDELGWAFLGNLRDNHLLVLDEQNCEEGIKILLGQDVDHVELQQQNLKQLGINKPGGNQAFLARATLGGELGARSLRKLTDSDNCFVCLGDSKRVIGHSLITNLLKKSDEFQLQTVVYDKILKENSFLKNHLRPRIPLADKFRVGCYILREFAQLPNSRMAFPHMTELVFDHNDHCLGLLIEPSLGPCHTKQCTEYRIFDALCFPNDGRYAPTRASIRDSYVDQGGMTGQDDSSKFGKTEDIIEDVVGLPGFQMVKPGNTKKASKDGEDQSKQQQKFTYENETKQPFIDANITFANPSLRKAFEMLDVSDKNVAQIASILAAIAILSKIEFTNRQESAVNAPITPESGKEPHDNEVPTLTKSSQQRAKDAAKYLGVESDDLIAFLTMTKVKVPEGVLQRNSMYKGANPAAANADGTSKNVNNPNQTGRFLDENRFATDIDPASLDLAGKTSLSFLKLELRRFVRVLYNRLYYRVILRSINRGLSDKIAPMFLELVEQFGQQNLTSANSSNFPIDSPAIIPCQARPGCLMHARALVRKQIEEGQISDNSNSLPFLTQNCKSVVSVIDGLSDVVEPFELNDSWTQFFKNYAFEKFQGLFEENLVMQQALYRKEGVKLHFSGVSADNSSSAVTMSKDKTGQHQHAGHILADLGPSKEERIGLLDNMNLIINILDNFLHENSEKGKEHRQTARTGGNLDSKFHEELILETSGLNSSNTTEAGAAGGATSSAQPTTTSNKTFQTVAAKKRLDISSKSKSGGRVVSFQLIHYTESRVEYDFTNWVSRNERSISLNGENLLKGSSLPMVRVVLAGEDAESVLKIGANNANNLRGKLSEEEQQQNYPTLHTRSFASCYRKKIQDMLNTIDTSVAGKTKFVRCLRINSLAGSKALPDQATWSKIVDNKYLAQQLLATKSTHLYQLLSHGFEWVLPHEPLCNAFMQELMQLKKKQNSSSGQARSGSKSSNRSSLLEMNALEYKQRFLLLNTENNSPHHGHVLHQIGASNRASGGLNLGQGSRGSTGINDIPSGQQAFSSNVLEFLELLLNLVLKRILKDHRKEFLNSFASEFPDESSSSEESDESTAIDDPTVANHLMVNAPSRIKPMKDVMVGKSLLFLHARHKRVYLFLRELLELVFNGDLQTARVRLGLTKEQMGQDLSVVPSGILVKKKSKSTSVLFKDMPSTSGDSGEKKRESSSKKDRKSLSEKEKKRQQQIADSLEGKQERQSEMEKKKTPVLDEPLSGVYKRPKKEDLLEKIRTSLDNGETLLPGSAHTDNMPRVDVEKDFQPKFKRPPLQLLKSAVKQVVAAKSSKLSKKKEKGIVVDLSDGIPLNAVQIKENVRKSMARGDVLDKNVSPQPEVAGNNVVPKFLKATTEDKEGVAAQVRKSSSGERKLMDRAGMGANVNTSNMVQLSASTAPPAKKRSSTTSPPPQRRVSKSDGIVRRMSQGSTTGKQEKEQIPAQPAAETQRFSAGRRFGFTAGSRGESAQAANAVAANATQERASTSSTRKSKKTDADVITQSSSLDHALTLKERMAMFNKAAHVENQIVKAPRSPSPTLTRKAPSVPATSSAAVVSNVAGINPPEGRKSLSRKSVKKQEQPVVPEPEPNDNDDIEIVVDGSPREAAASAPARKSASRGPEQQDQRKIFRKSSTETFVRGSESKEAAVIAAAANSAKKTTVPVTASTLPDTNLRKSVRSSRTAAATTAPVMPTKILKSEGSSQIAARAAVAAARGQNVSAKGKGKMMGPPKGKGKAVRAAPPPVEDDTGFFGGLFG